MIAPKEQTIVVGEPSLQCREAVAVLARLDLSDEWRLFLAPRINIDISAIATIPTSATQRHPLGVHTHVFVESDNLPFNAPTFSLARPAHDVSYQPIGRMTI